MLTAFRLEKKTYGRKELRRLGVDGRIILKLKAISLQVWAGNEVSSRLRLPDFKTVGT
jgi:hypothetical protein